MVHCATFVSLVNMASLLRTGDLWRGEERGEHLTDGVSRLWSVSALSADNCIPSIIDKFCSLCRIQHGSNRQLLCQMINL